MTLRTYIVFGGQFGSEAKGEVVAWLASRLRPEAVVRTGGPNAGHTFTIRRAGKDAVFVSKFPMQQIPCGWHVNGTALVIAAGSLVNPTILKRELDLIDTENPYHGPVFIDPQAAVLDHSASAAEKAVDMNSFNGSTQEGIGYVRSQYMLRKAQIAFDNAELVGLAKQGRIKIIDTAAYLNAIWSTVGGGDIILESTQGFGLSLSLSGFYPFCTSRDLTPMQVLNDVGLSYKGPVIRGEMKSMPQIYSICVLRTFPIRVAGNSGPMGEEVSWDEMCEIAGYDIIPEKTTVTKRIRRIAWFNKDYVARMDMICRPDAYFLTFADYVDCDLRPLNSNLDLTHDQYTDKLLHSDKLIKWLWGHYMPAFGGGFNSLPAWISVAPGWFVQYQPHNSVELEGGDMFTMLPTRGGLG